MHRLRLAAVMLPGWFILILANHAGAQDDQPKKPMQSELRSIPELPKLKKIEPPPAEVEPPPLPAPLEQPLAPFLPPPAAGYRAAGSVTGLGIAAPSIDVPLAVDVVPQALIRDQQALRLSDLLRDVPGAVLDPSGLVFFNQLTLRGFPVREFEFRRNGFVDFSLVPRELANIDRVEFLKGPASVLYGSGQPGGVVNLLTKMPQPNLERSAVLELGSFDLYRFVYDTTGLVSDGHPSTYRGIVALQKSQDFRDFGYLDRVLAAPTLVWPIDADTTLTVVAEFFHTEMYFDTGLPTLGGQLGLLPISRSIGEPDDFANETDYRLQVLFDRRLDECWYLRLGMQSLWFPAEGRRHLPLAFLPGGTDLIRVQQYASSFQEQSHSLIANLAGDLRNGSRRHQLLFGTELNWQVVPDFLLRQSNPLATPLLLDVFDPVYQNPAFGGPDPPMPFLNTINQQQYRYGFYAEDLVSLGEHWKVLAGARYDIACNQFEHTTNIPLGFPVGGTTPLTVPRAVEADANYYRWSPRLGLVYQPIPETLALYGSYSQSFDVILGSQRNGQPLTPETGYQWEGGLKADLLEGRLGFTACGFYLSKDGLAFLDPVDDLFFVQVGEGRSQGAELSLAGNLTDRWGLVANYAYIDTRLSSDEDPRLDGKRFRGIPLNTANLWSRYNLIQTPRYQLGMALGLVYVGERYGDLENTFVLPDYCRWDLGVYYRRGCLGVSLYVENLFDEEYYVGALSPLQVFPGAPTNARASLRWDF